MHGIFRSLVFATVLRVASPVLLVLALVSFATIAKFRELVDGNLGLTLVISVGLAWLLLARLRPGTLHEKVETLRTAFRGAPEAGAEAPATDPVEDRIREYLQGRQQAPAPPRPVQRAAGRSFGKRGSSARSC